MREQESSPTLYRRGGIRLDETDEGMILSAEGVSCRLTSHPWEPCLYIRLPDGRTLTLHNAFETREIGEAARSGGTVRMITGQSYDIAGLCDLLICAVRLNRESADIGYVEGWRFAECLRQEGAVSADTAVDLSAMGLRNPHTMDVFVRRKRVAVTPDGRYYVREEKKG